MDIGQVGDSRGFSFAGDSCVVASSHMATWKKTLLGLAVLYLAGAAFVAYPTVDGAATGVETANKQKQEVPPAIAPPPTVRTLPVATGSPYNFRFMAFGGIIVITSAIALSVFIRGQSREPAA